MDANRIVNIILTELSLENLKLQETLERAINNSDKIETKVLEVKNALHRLVINEGMITKFQSMVQPQNNEVINQTKNGEV